MNNLDIMNIIVTGGSGFIGSTLIKNLLERTTYKILNIDKLTYASNIDTLLSYKNYERYQFIHGDITNKDLIEYVLSYFKPNIIMHLAAETHVDRSINNPDVFIKTNIIGTYQLLDSTLDFWRRQETNDKKNFRFIYISTDEVYGELKSTEGKFNEQSTYSPNSPYSASKASGDHLVRAWNVTYGLPTIITHSTNNYGPNQNSEKLIPKTIQNALNGHDIPVYGSGDQIRDWLFVDDHVEALMLIMKNGLPGKVYNIGGDNEQKNITVIEKICQLLQSRAMKQTKQIKYTDLIKHIPDRPGHDYRYALDNNQMKLDFGWAPRVNFHEGLTRTIQWYLDNKEN